MYLQKVRRDSDMVKLEGSNKFLSISIPYSSLSLVTKEAIGVVNTLEMRKTHSTYQSLLVKVITIMVSRICQKFEQKQF